jgi:hypothetical protein
MPCALAYHIPIYVTVTLEPKTKRTREGKHDREAPDPYTIAEGKSLRLLRPVISSVCLAMIADLQRVGGTIVPTNREFKKRGEVQWR